MAMTAWAAKFCTNSICLSVKGRTSWWKILIVPTRSFSLSMGTMSSVRAPASSIIGTYDGFLSK